MLPLNINLANSLGNLFIGFAAATVRTAIPYRFTPSASYSLHREHVVFQTYPLSIHRGLALPAILKPIMVPLKEETDLVQTAEPSTILARILQEVKHFRKIIYHLLRKRTIEWRPASIFATPTGFAEWILMLRGTWCRSSSSAAARSIHKITS